MCPIDEILSFSYNRATARPPTFLSLRSKRPVRMSVNPAERELRRVSTLSSCSATCDLFFSIEKLCNDLRRCVRRPGVFVFHSTERKACDKDDRNEVAHRLWGVKGIGACLPWPELICIWYGHIVRVLAYIHTSESALRETMVVRCCGGSTVVVAWLDIRYTALIHSYQTRL